ncbi:nucleotide-diphospho-sugar transferase [Elsinoe ampelina]|uniref:Nucleotide-diphospho-sugar transferase n=1 Tax=Elsinoe ampelina TaxID=302913 RepID=A0A6A6GA33_9PEZI|nr:nucleotide-diphospho-sugar transferase [Elsinoe ampelina]
MFPPALHAAAPIALPRAVASCLNPSCVCICFETYLKSVEITFDTFPSDYSAALRLAGTKRFDADYNFNTFPNTTQIPRLIHFIWFKDLYNDTSRPSQIPTKGSHGPGKCIEFNPSFETKIWNSTEARSLIATSYPWFLPTYDAYRHPIQRVDAFKYFLLYHHGGVYVDMDVACRRDLRPLLTMPAWFPKAQPFGVNNDIMATRPGHPLFRKMIESLQARDVNLVSPYLTIFWSTGPQFTSDLVKSWWSDQRHRYPRYTFDRDAKVMETPYPEEDGIMILPEMFYSEKYTFFGHSPGGTWYGNDVMVVLWVIDRLWIIAVVAVTGTLGFVAWAQRRRLRSFRKGGHGYKYMPMA